MLEAKLFVDWDEDNTLGVRKQVENLANQRCIGIIDRKKVKTELITFCDASKLAYGELHT